MRNESLNPESVPAGLDQFVPSTTPATSGHAPGTLVDKYGRHITYIRLSITDRCDFRCFYCMAEEMEFLPRDHLLSLEECLRVIRSFGDRWRWLHQTFREVVCSAGIDRDVS